MKVDWKECPKCGFYIATNRLKHFNFCNGEGPRAKRDEHKIKRGQHWRKGLTKNTDSSIKAAAETLKARFANGELTPTGFCADDYDNERRVEAGKKSGGYRENAGYSKKFYVSDSFGTRTCLQSSHELALSEMLNERGIIWRREGCFWYDDKRYFPDFYLVDFDIYLDVKNEYLIKIDAEKITKVIEQNKGIKLEVFTLADAEEFLNKL